MGDISFEINILTNKTSICFPITATKYSLRRESVNSESYIAEREREYKNLRKEERLVWI